jgi:NAD(P)H-flavin reductase
VGINPIMSMLSAMDVVGHGGGKLGGMPKRVEVLYTSRRGRAEDGEAEKVLFEERLAELAAKWTGFGGVEFGYTLYETSSHGRGRDGEEMEGAVKKRYRRITHEDLFAALGPVDDRADTVVYVCGLPGMTDEFVDVLSKAEGLEPRRVRTEKWW